ncbi:MAG: hypothetical protein AB7O66_09405 [Limisphaerales bacterium]
MRAGFALIQPRFGDAAAASWRRWLVFLGRWAVLISLGRDSLRARAAVGDSGTSSSPSAALRVWIRQGDQAGGGYGTVLGGNGDLNGDGFGDLVIGEPGFALPDGSQPGRVLVFHGGPNGFGAQPDQVLTGREPGARFGAFLAVLGDVNGDAIDDLAVGSPDYHGGVLRQGQIEVYSGSTTGFRAEPDWTRLGGMVEMRLGRVARAGDLNADGINDILVFAEGLRLPLGGPGEAWIIAGSSTGLTHQVIWNRRGTQKSELYGNAVAAGGDLNADGLPDLVLGTMFYDGREEDEGRVEVFFGRQGVLAPEPAWSAAHTSVRTPFRLSSREQRFGSAVAAAGDLNGDGIGDLVVGGSHVAHEDEKEGRAFVWFGSKTGLRASPDWTAEGNEVDGHFATGVAGVGDVNGDGLDDLLISGRTLDHGDVNEGVLAVYYGSRRGLSVWPDWTAESDERGAELGTVVQALGDVNGDGLADFAVGARYHERGGKQVGEVRVYWGHRGGLPNSSGWSPELPLWERGRRGLDRVVARAGSTIAFIGLAGLLGLGAGIVLLAQARRRALAQVKDLRSRLHDFVGSEMAGVRVPGRRLPELAEELRATIWTVKQDAPTVAGLVGFLTDWAWRFANEQKVTLRLNLPRQAVKPRPIDFDVAEAFQAFVRVAMTHAVDHLGARRMELAIASTGRALEVALRVPADECGGAKEPGQGAVEGPGGEGQARRLEKLREQLEAVGGVFECKEHPDGEVTFRASSPLSPRRR